VFRPIYADPTLSLKIIVMCKHIIFLFSACPGFTCLSDGSCIDNALVCDRTENCKDGSDEKQCGEQDEGKGEGTSFSLSLSPSLPLSNFTSIAMYLMCKGHEDSVILSVCKVHIPATRWRFYT
jgi:hypothetical protein